MAKRNIPEDILACAAGLTTAYKVVNHHQSFNTFECNITFNSKLQYPD